MHIGASVLSSGYSKGKGQIHSKELRCRGWERRVTDCPQTNIDVNLCSHDDDVGIRCPPSEQEMSWHYKLIVHQYPEMALT